MPRERDDFDDDFPARPKSGVTGTHVILAGVSTGLVAALVGGGIWLSTRDWEPAEIDPRNSAAAKLGDAARKVAEQREAADQRLRTPADDDN